jgi:hypothetical protein
MKIDLYVHIRRAQTGTRKVSLVAVILFGLGADAVGSEVGNAQEVAPSRYAHSCQGSAATSAPQLPASSAPATVDVPRLLGRARSLFGLGDIAGARLILQHAAAGNDPAALSALAETYDPLVLKARHVLGLKGDPDAACALYQQASFQRMKLAQTRLAGVIQSLGTARQAGSMGASPTR